MATFGDITRAPRNFSSEIIREDKQKPTTLPSNYYRLQVNVGSGRYRPNSTKNPTLSVLSVVGADPSYKLRAARTRSKKPTWSEMVKLIRSPTNPSRVTRPWIIFLDLVGGRGWWADGRFLCVFWSGGSVLTNAFELFFSFLPVSS